MLDYSGLVTIQILLCAASPGPDMRRRFTVLALPAANPIHPPECNFSSTNASYIARRSTLSRRARILELRSEASFEVRETAMTARDTPQARPRATLLGTYCTTLALSAVVIVMKSTYHVGHVLLLADERDVEHNAQRLGVGGEDDQLAGAAVDRLGRLVLRLG